VTAAGAFVDSHYNETDKWSACRRVHTQHVPKMWITSKWPHRKTRCAQLVPFVIDVIRILYSFACHGARLQAYFVGLEIAHQVVRVSANSARSNYDVVHSGSYSILVNGELCRSPGSAKVINHAYFHQRDPPIATLQERTVDRSLRNCSKFGYQKLNKLMR